MDLNTKAIMDDFPLSSQERGELLTAIKRFALEGYLRAEIGIKEDFEKMWGEAFCAD
jgi:hypothetical protein